MRIRGDTAAVVGQVEEEAQAVEAVEAVVGLDCCWAREPAVEATNLASPGSTSPSEAPGGGPGGPGGGCPRDTRESKESKGAAA